MDEKELLWWLSEVQGHLSDLQQRVQEMVNCLSSSDPEQPVVEPRISEPIPRLRPAPTEIVTLYDLRRGEYRHTITLEAGFPDRTSKRVENWKNVVIEIIRWHIQEGKITGDTPPSRARRKYPVVSRDKDALPPRQPIDIVMVDGWWVDTYGAVSKNKQRNLIDVCQSVGTDPSAFWVKIIP